MATLRKREDRGNRYELSYVDIDKRRYRIDTGTTDIKVAKVWLKKAEELLSQAKLGEIEKAGRVDADVVARKETEAQIPTIEEYKEYYEERCRHDLELAENTILVNNAALDALAQITGNKQLHQIIESDVILLKKRLSQEGKSPTTIAIYHRHLRAAWSRAKKYKFVSENPFMEVALARPKPQKSGQSKDMAIDEVKTLLDHIEKSDEIQFGNYVRFLLYTGCRRSEILYLTWEDIDLEKLTLTVYVSKSRKTLVIPINKALKRTIDKLDRKTSGYVFISNSKRHSKNRGTAPWSEDFVTHQFKKHIIGAKLPKHYTLHSLRHTYVTYLRSQGIPTDIIQKLVGHSSTRITSEHYDATIALHFRDQADLMDLET